MFIGSFWRQLKLFSTAKGQKPIDKRKNIQNRFLPFHFCCLERSFDAHGCLKIIKTSLPESNERLERNEKIFMRKKSIERVR